MADGQAAPHLRVDMSTSEMMWLIAASLAPAAVYGLVLFGAAAASVLAVAVGASLLAEVVTTLPSGRFTLADGSAFVTGLLVGLVLPAGVPLFVPAAASAFGILVIKQSFGGLGRNWMNPAMGGVLFALLSWPDAAAQWLAPVWGGAVSGSVSPLDAVRAVTASTAAHDPTPLAALSRTGYLFSGLDSVVVGWLNDHVLARLGTGISAGSFDVLIGHVPGGIGSTCVPLILLGAWLPLRRGAIRWQAPVMCLGTFAILTAVFGGLATGEGWMAGGPGFHLLSGSLVLGAFYCATDPVTSPLTIRGRFIFGAVLGVLTFSLRFFGGVGDGVAAAVVLGNCAAPLLDRRRQPQGPAGMRGEAA